MSGLADKLEVATAARAGGGDVANALTIFDMIGRQQAQVAKALPKGMDAGRFVRMVLTEVRRTPKLAECDPATLLGAMMLSAQTGLEPGGPLGLAFLIPRWSGRRKVMEAQFQIGYKGYIQLAARSGVPCNARTVREGDTFDWWYGTDEQIQHRPVMPMEGPSVAWYAVGKGVTFVVIDRNVAEQAKAASQSGDRGPWGTHYDAMAQKTALLRLSNFLPLSTESALAIAADGAVVAGPSVSVEDAAQAALDAETDPDPDEPEGVPDETADPEPPLDEAIQ